MVQIVENIKESLWRWTDPTISYSGSMNLLVISEDGGTDIFKLEFFGLLPIFTLPQIVFSEKSLIFWSPKVKRSEEKGANYKESEIYGQKYLN